MPVYVSDLDREELPHVVGPYLLVDLLGSGGMGRVFRARSLTGEGGIREHALKVLRDAVDTEVRRAMFLREARIGHLLRHDNLVRTDDYFVHGDERFLVLELVEGPNLTELLAARREPLPPTEAVGLVAQAARGLHSAHSIRDEHGQPYGLVHRDLKPDNLLVRNDGVVKVADFGMAKPTHKDMTAYVTEETDDAPRGTLPYMSPEQLRGMKLDVRSDVWAMGCVLYFAMTGRHLFGTDSGLGILMRILRLDFPDGPDPWGHVDRMLPGAGSVLKKCVTAEPEDRFASAAALAEALEFIGDPASARQTLAVISARHLPDWMGVPFDQLEDPRTAQAIPIEDVDSSRTMPVPAVEPIGPEGVQGELGGRGATAMKVIPVTRPGGPTPKAPTRPRPDPTRPRPAAGEPERAPQPRKATAHPAPTPRGPSPRQVERARRNRNLWIGIGVAGGVLVLLLAAVLGLLLRG